MFDIKQELDALLDEALAEEGVQRSDKRMDYC